ncbi:hypothetical protein [Paenibacillus sp. URB8-2]|uniref:hypothetical protein n=1 Tax=Paenibacillus sp. URB8-2 TaxID=2741301 RepID=UPI0015BDF56B|nr:hypothetical protein [Paenibacillus sp. URB8-2]BCG60413.1 hypothetical protein PUR_38380 [Paenibacillus sp. URB8-2]
MRKIALTAALAGALAGLLLFSSIALADEQKKNDGHTDGHGTTQVQPVVQEESKVSTPAQTPATLDAQSHNMTSEEHQNMNMETEESGGGHGGHENVVESPPNIPVLSTFLAINIAFLLIGIWNKWFRKKGGALA